MPSVEGAGVELAYEERGEGAAVLLVHAIGGRPDAWPDVPARVIAYDRRGYGGSGAPEPYARTTVEEQAEDAAAVLAALDAVPAVIAGEGVGALVALDLAGATGRSCAAWSPWTRRCWRSCLMQPRRWLPSGCSSTASCARTARPRPCASTCWRRA